MLSAALLGAANAAAAPNSLTTIAVAALGSGGGALDCPGVLFGNPEFPIPGGWLVDGTSADFDGNGAVDLVLASQGVSVLFNANNGPAFEIQPVCDSCTFFL